ncbi:MAG: bifunctional adenosylcobinamide kinase/adenosylcobinamide-phosphate guanylyltransferase [Clostridia bacterium]|nr:bifunctional adenosylcobinamide kinase/adenosylcobinamide-phosphate guanylyltransferase [Clostridia bacterium]
MRMIIGGVAQGKLNFAMRKYNITENDIFDIEICAFEEIENKRCINNYDRVIKALMERKENPLAFTENLIKRNSDMIIIMNEIGNGIIPIEKEERLWREQTGKIGCRLAELSESVERIICGIAVVLK